MTVKHTEKPRKSPLPHPARRPVAVARSEARFAAPPTARFVPAKAVGSFVPTLTRKAFEKFGFSTATLITDWARIAGAELARYTMPDRLRWPRGESCAADAEDGARRGATLILRVDPARALDVEYRARQIMDRINGYFGYRAVESIRLVQAPLPAPARGEARDAQSCGRPHPGAFPSPAPKGPENAAGPGAMPDPLLAALARLERGVLRDGRRRSA